jgi:L-alanine-DL-glutamate epimerase-like enolase superfamily enzyme
MKVTNIKRYPVKDDERGYFIVKVETDESIYSLGKIDIRNWSGAIDKAIEHLSQIVVGEDLFSTERLWQHMYRGGFFPEDKVYSCAINAINIALWDIKGKFLNLPCTSCSAGRFGTTRSSATLMRKVPLSIHWLRTAFATWQKTGSSCAGASRRPTPNSSNRASAY